MSELSPVDYDAELQQHNERLRRSYGISSGDRVLDIGCGTGQTTREAARLASPGVAFGIDVDTRMIERARELSLAEGMGNVSFEVGDAEVFPFPSGHFGVAISRFGTMFFAHPAAAFANIARALRPHGRLVMMVWQSHARNEWSVAIERALRGGEGTTDPVGSDAAFSLADPAAVEQILLAAGFADVELADVDVPVFYGRDVDAALDFVRRFSDVRNALAQLAPADAEGALERLRETLAAHQAGSGVWFASRSWIVTARRR